MFTEFSQKVRQKFNEMVATKKVLKVQIDKKVIFNTYLEAFEDDPIYITNSEHNCNCCKQFIRTVGSAVVVANDGSLITAFDIDIEGKYQPVAKALSEYIKSCNITGAFSYKYPTIGQETTYHETKGSFNHFYVKNPLTQQTLSLESRFKGFKRALEEISDDVLIDVIELIKSNAILQSTTYLKMVKDFAKAKQHIKSNNNLMWKHTFDYYASIRNTAIGTLLVDLSTKDVDMEQAIRSYNAKVDPRNYKQAKAIVTKRSAEATIKALNDLGYENALERRQATLNDVSINHVLFKNTSNIVGSGDSIEGLLGQAVINKKPTQALDIKIEDFIKDILPKASDLKVFLSKHKLNQHKVSLTTAVNTEVNSMFKWDNPFGWSYKGKLADSIEERVKQAGGVVDSDFVISLSWDTKDDLDLALKSDIDSEREVYFNKKTNGIFTLDIDANANKIMEKPVENIYCHKSVEALKGKKYVIKVHNYTQRTVEGSNYSLRVKVKDKVFIINSKSPLRHKALDTLIISLSNKGNEVTLTQSKNMIINQKDVEGKFFKVNSVMLSPNYWDSNKVGNKHYFFMLDNVEFDNEDLKGFYVEFLKEELKPYRRVMQYLANTKQCNTVNNALVGVGFSVSQRKELIIKVNNKRTYNVQF